MWQKHGPGAVDFSRSDCVSCHMPKRRTEDVVHVVMTDHQIQRRIPARDLLAPLREKTDEEQIYRGEVTLYYPKTGLEGALRQVYLGMAQVKEKEKLERGLGNVETSSPPNERATAGTLLRTGGSAGCFGTKRSS